MLFILIVIFLCVSFTFVPLPTSNDTVLTPGVEYLTKCGPGPVALAGEAPEPKFQICEVIIPLEKSVKTNISP